jgi:hypothetical protein
VTGLSYVQINGFKGWVGRNSLEELFELLEGVGLQMDEIGVHCDRVR